MAKDPAFLFYPNDWLGGTMGMTFEEKGAYMELLMLQFNRGHMTKDMIGQTVGQLWVNIQDKFKVDPNGLYYNERLDIEKEKRKTFTESRRNNVLGNNQYTKIEGHNKGHMSSHMENVNENVNDTDNNKERRAEIFKEKVYQYHYPETMLNDFLDYWTESSEKGKLMRYEKEKVFDIKKRLATWQSRSKTFKQQNNGQQGNSFDDRIRAI